MRIIQPDWPAPPSVHAFCSSRIGGHSKPPFDSLNLSDAVGDDEHLVRINREQLADFSGMPQLPQWFPQVHGTNIVAADAPHQEADGTIARSRGQVCAVLTADCLPVLLCEPSATQVAAVHAGWRGLAVGILCKAVRLLAVESTSLMVWLGPAIGPQAFEVGVEVYQKFIALNNDYGAAFQSYGEKYLANIYQIARIQLAQVGVERVYGGQYCTYQQQTLFYSYRRAAQTGRMGSFIWLD